MDQRNERQDCARTAALERYQILDSEPEPVFDHLTRLAASLYDAPMAAITFTAGGRVWSKSTFGFEAAEHIDISTFSTHVAEHGETLIIENVATDQRFASDPGTASAQSLRFYAGAPLRTPNGQPIGTFCIADTRPRPGFTAADADRLQDLAALVIEQLEFRSKHLESSHSKSKSAVCLTTMSHDLRTPMNGVLGMAELLLIDDDLSDRHRHRVEIIKRSGESLLSMLDHMIERSKLDAGSDHAAGDSPDVAADLAPDAQSEQAAGEDVTGLSGNANHDIEQRVIRDVLVAEDNPDMALLIEDLLEEAGYNATTAPNGASVLKILDEKHIDIVLMDGRMPDMSGFETTDLIRQLPDDRAKVPIIALTGEALVGDRERYLSAGMDDYVAKPVTYETLIKAIERCGGGQRSQATSETGVTG
ncbi:MAG: response regulator [Pseudomonadota bacterium]